MSLSNEMRRLTKGFPAAYDDRVAMVATIRGNTARELSGFRAAHQSMAAKQRQGLHDNVTSMMASLDTAHQSMAAEQRQGLTDYVCGLRDNITRMLASFDAAHQRMAGKQSKRLAAGRAHLASDVSKMRGRLQADQSQACKIWNDFAIVMGERRAKKSGAPSPKAQTAKAQKPAPPAAGRAIADDLTTIKGLGAGRQLSLNKMGIHTFAQLAKSVPQKIRKALGASGPLANVEEWIKEARKQCK